jgi:8-oxo-dGTP diphosphatase
MKHRIRAAALIVDPDQRILLVRETDPVTSVEFWVPPGGGLEVQDSSIIECLCRELREETGLTIEVGRLVYLREFAERSKQVHHIELFFEALDHKGNINFTSSANAISASDLSRHAQWFHQHELENLQVYPEELKRQFWLDRMTGVKHTKYLGVEVEKMVP